MKKQVLTLLSFITLLTCWGATSPGFIVSAHRGYSNKGPENTLSAFQFAIDAGANYFELDIRKTVDDSIVVLHDGTVDRTTNGAGNLSVMTYAETQLLDAGYASKFGNQFTGEKIPTLRESLLLAKGKIKVEIEIKESGLADAVVAIVEDLEMEDEVSVISFNYNEIKRIKELDASIPVKYLIGSNWGQTEIDLLLAIGGEFIGPSGVSSPALVQLAHDNNIQIIAYTLNSSTDIQNAINAGLDGIATDFPERAIALKNGVYIPENSLIANWDFQSEIVGGSINDLSGFSNHVQVFGTPENIEINSINGLAFDGTEDYLQVPVSNSLEATFNEITIMTKIKLNELPSEITDSWSPIYDSNNDIFVMYEDKASQELRFKITTENGAQKPGIPQSELNKTDWITIFGVYNGTSVKVYLNDALVAEAPLTGRIVDVQQAFIGKNGTNTQLFNGAISELKIYNYAFTEGMIKASFVEQSLIAHWDLVSLENDSAVDFSGYDNKLSIFGNPTPVKRGGYDALSFNGTSDYLEVNASPVLDAPHAQLTLTAWVKFNDLPSEITDSWDPVYDSDGDQFVLYSDKGTNEFRFKAATSGGAERPGIPGNLLDKNVWYHIAGVYTGQKAQVYLNGVLMDEHNLTGTVNTGQKAFIGRNGTNSQYFSGSIGEIKIYNYAMSASELKNEARPSGLIALWKMDEIVDEDTVWDYSGYNHHLTVIGDPKPVVSSSGFTFDGTQNYLKVPSSPLLDSVGGTITMTSWIMMNELPSEISDSWDPIFDADEDIYVIYGDKSNNELRFKVSTTAGAERPGIPASVLSTGTWFFVAGVYDGTHAKVYINGQLADEHALTGTIKTNQTAFIAKNGTNTQHFNGKIGETRIYNYALSEDSILTLANANIVTNTFTAEINNGLNVYPNPATDHVTVTRSSSEVLTARLLSLGNTEVLNFGSYSEQDIELELSHVNSGIYILEIQEGSKTTYQKISVK